MNVRERIRSTLTLANKPAETPIPVELPTPMTHLAVAEPVASYVVTAKRAVFVIGLETGIPYDQPNSRTLAELNLGRDLFPRDVPGPLVIWLPDYAVTAVARFAPDFWAWRSGVFEFTSGEAERGAATTLVVHEGPDDAALWNLPWEAKLLRRRQLESLLDDYSDLPDDDRVDAERAAILRDLGAICQATPDPACALDYYHQALRIFERLGNMLERAETLGGIADVSESRGQLDEALRIRQDEELPTYERLGQEQEKAWTLGKIADILQARGQLDEALRIRQEEQLPIWERLGDVRSRAVTLGKIADVLQARGQLDEALRILRDDVLPAFERLGAAT